jgi:hypothetical protein
MIAFEIHLNGTKKCTAGIGKPGVLSTTLTWVLREPEGRRRKSEKMELGVGGLVSRTDDFLEWLQRDIRLGDEIAIRIVEVANSDAPKTKQRQVMATPAQIRRNKQALIRKFAKEFGWKIVTRSDVA